MNAPIVSFNHVGKSFDVDGFELEAIREFNLDIAEGEFVAIVGSSGCGKSTLLRLLVGLDTQFRGQITVDGKAVSGIGSERGIVFQEHRLFPWLTVADNIGLGLVNEPLSAEQKQKRVNDFIELVGLSDFT
ncbi:MAG: putative sulfur transport system, ATP-binding protein, partial [Pseudomonas sp.]|nr:putative sulfur transport system, ATP-binding protein [Pseudomonas sp.]